jgi:hypothetical protein
VKLLMSALVVKPMGTVPTYENKSEFDSPDGVTTETATGIATPEAGVLTRNRGVVNHNNVGAGQRGETKLHPGGGPESKTRNQYLGTSRDTSSVGR